MKQNSRGIRNVGRHRQETARATTRGFEFRTALRILTRPGTLAMCALFFIAATPFELEQSGYAYLIKIGAMVCIVAYAIAARGARIESFNPIVLIIVFVMLMTNISALTDRAILAVASIITGTLLGQMHGIKWNSEFRVIVTIYLVIHFCGMIVAAVLFYTMGEVIELHNLIFPYQSRTEGINILGRLSGFHTEPGTYSQWTLMALLLLALIEGKLYSVWKFLVATSVVLTASMWGILAFGVFAGALAIDLLRSAGNTRAANAIFILLFIASILYFFDINASNDVIAYAMEYFELKSELNTLSGIDKLYAMEFMQQEFINVLIIGQPLEPGFCPACVSPQDSGIGMNGTYYLGFVPFAGLIVVLATQVIRCWNISILIPLALILVWKASIYEPLLWIIVGYILNGSSKKYYNVIKEKISK